MSKELYQGAELHLSKNTIRVNLIWPEFKKYLNGTYKKLLIQYVEDAERYMLYAMEDNLVYTCTLVKVPSDYLETFDTSDKQVSHNAERAEFEANFKSKGNKPKPVTPDGKAVVSMFPTEGTRTTIITPNWCDRTTWYQQATRVIDATPTGGLIAFQLAHTNIVDTYHGKITGEDFLKDASNNSYRVVVKVNDVIKAEQDPHVGSGGDYVIDYTTGIITFQSTLNANDVVKVTYHYAGSSEFVIKPATGKLLKIRRAEVQFSDNIVLTDSVRFQLYIGGAPYGDAVVYKTMMDYINEANGSLPSIQSLGVPQQGSNWRAMTTPVVTFPWDYTAMTELKSSIGMEIRIKLEHDVPFDGDVATATFYCLSENE